MKDAYCNTQFKRFAKYFKWICKKKEKYYIGFRATETSENVWWYDGSKVIFRSESNSKFLHAMQENPDITIEELSKEAGIVIAVVKNNKD